MPTNQSPDTMSPAQRTRELARLLATGILRLRSRPVTENPPQTARPMLEVSPATRLTVPRG